MVNQRQDYKKILINQTAFLGDVILTTALIREMKKLFLDAEIDILVIPQTSGIFKYNPNINDIIIFNKRKVMSKLFSIIKLIFKIRKNCYQLAFSVQSSFTSSLLLFLGKVPRRVGFERQKLLTDKVPLDGEIHASIRHLNLLNIFSNSTFDFQTEVFWSEAEEDLALDIINKSREQYQYLIGIAPGSIWNTKRWPEENFTMLSAILAQHNFGIFLLGGKDDFNLCQRIAENSKSSAVNLAGQLSIPESCSLIEKLDLMISNDSAPLHIANAVQTDVFVIFGPTVKKFGFYPFRKNDKIFEVDLYCRPCSKHGGRTCPERHFNCMKRILPSDLAGEVIDYFNKKYKKHFN